MKPLFGCLMAVFIAALLPSGPSVGATPLKADKQIEAKVERVMSQMSTEEKVGQLLMIGFGGTSVTPHIRYWLQERQVGGVALFSRNIENFEQTARFTRELHDLAKGGTPLFIALDQEGGNVVRVKDGAMVLPGNMALGATRSSTLAYVSGQALGIDLRLLGFNMNLAPVLDVNSNPRNPVIGIRSYGERPELVGALGTWFVRGQQEMGIVAVAKHFPGHGDTHSDSHFSMPAITADAQRLNDVELVPFKQAMDAGLDAVMTAHIALPNIAEDTQLPATLSHTILTKTLRNKLKFDGIVITDGLEMQGIVQRYGSGRAAVLAIVAGADMPMILWTKKAKEEVYQSLLRAVQSGEITEQRLNESVGRILRAKARRGLFNQRLAPLKYVLKNRNDNPVHQKVATQIAEEAVTLVRNHGELLPIEKERYRKIVVLAPPGELGKTLATHQNTHVITTPYVPNRARRQQDVEQVAAAAKDADLLVLAVVNRYHVDMARAIMAQADFVPTAVVSLASPYYLASFPNVDAYVCAYSYLDVTQQAVGQALLGHAPMIGRLPISIPGFYSFGHRIVPNQRFARFAIDAQEPVLSP